MVDRARQTIETDAGGQGDRRHRLPLVDFSRDGARKRSNRAAARRPGSVFEEDRLCRRRGITRIQADKAEQPGVPILDDGFKRPPGDGQARMQVRPAGRSGRRSIR